MTYRSDDEKQRERIKKAMQSIADVGGRDYMFRQLAEECAELTQAALKFVRLENKETPKSADEVIRQFLEEIADVRIMLDIVETACISGSLRDEITEIYHEKLNRFRSRVIPL